jgi:hypothetical protein
MNATEIKIIENNIKQQLINPNTAPLIISGAPGTTKSATLQQIARDNNFAIVDVSFLAIIVEELSGIPNDILDPTMDKYSIDGRPAMITKWSIPQMIADCNKLASEDNNVMLLLEDMHAAPPHIQNYLFKLLLQKELGGYKLDPRVAISGSMNSSEAAGFNGFNSAVRNRMGILQVEFNFDQWFEGYARPNLHYLVTSFLKRYPHQVIDENESTQMEGSATPRSWTALSAEIENLPIEFITEHAAKLASLHVSANTAAAFAKHVVYINTIDFSSKINLPEPEDLSQLEPLESIIYSYIVNFVDTIKHGEAIFDLINKNIEQTSFIGFILAELYIKYKQPSQTDGIRFVIDKLLNKSLKN